MEIVGGVFDIPSDIEVTLEGIPQTFSHDKLLAMKQCGMNRISMGVQQLDEELIKASGRRQRADQVFRTLESCQALDLPISVDLIFGWPNQTIEQMVRDLETVAATGVAHITHYELNVAGRTDFARNRRGELPSQEENLEMYRAGKAVLEARGYTQVTPYDFERRDATVPTSYLYEELFRKPFATNGNGPIGFDAWGWGYAGISFFFGTPRSPGWAFMNHVRVDEYFRCIREGRHPVMRGYHYTPADLRLHLLFQEMQGLAVDRAAYRAAARARRRRRARGGVAGARPDRVGHGLGRRREGAGRRGLLPAADPEHARPRPAGGDAPAAAGIHHRPGPGRGRGNALGPPGAGLIPTAASGSPDAAAA